MRVGTWNLAGRWGPDHERTLRDADCDVWLLTEVSERAQVDGYSSSRTAADMAPSRAWASVLSRLPVEALADPHPASAAVRIDDAVYCSSVLPWRACGQNAPWQGADHETRTRSAVDALMSALPADQLVWGGDWNHAFSGTEYAGSKAGRLVIQEALDARRLQVPTATAGHRLDGLSSIDHIAVADALAASVEHVPVSNRLSDHDAYVVEVG